MLFSYCYLVIDVDNSGSEAHRGLVRIVYYGTYIIVRLRDIGYCIVDIHL